jgi:hypothetical protein
VDDLEPRERVRRAKALLSPDAAVPIGREEAVKRLIRDEDDLLAALAAAYAAEAGLPELVSIAQQEAKRRPELLKIGGEQPAGLELSHA